MKSGAARIDRQQKITFYDENGNLYKKEVSNSLVDYVMRQFSGRTKAVRRRSGGLAPAELCQVVLIDIPGGERPEVRLRVKFSDVHADGKKTENTKVVPLSELLEMFAWELEGDRRQSYGVDFGNGVVPVHVFHFQEEAGKPSLAYFADVALMERALKASRDKIIDIPVYCVPKEALRWLGSDTGRSSELDQARRNYEAQLVAGKRPIPETWRAGHPIAVPGGADPADLRKYLRVWVQRRATEETSGTINLKVQWENNRPLMPFGELED